MLFRSRQQARIGTLWQDLRLIEELTVQQNLNAARLAHWSWPKALLNLFLPVESEACRQALAQVELDPALLHQPVTALSGGQRQRLAIARALLLEPTVLLLDDPTSAIDPETEREILEAMEAAMEGRTTFIVAHRLSTLRRADLILVLDRGRLIQSGTHAELMAQDGQYRRAILVQSEGATA